METQILCSLFGLMDCVPDEQVPKELIVRILLIKLKLRNFEID